MKNDGHTIQSLIPSEQHAYLMRVYRKNTPMYEYFCKLHKSVVRVPRWLFNRKLFHLLLRLRLYIAKKTKKDICVYCFSYRYPKGFKQWCKKHDIAFYHIEDGIIRSRHIFKYDTISLFIDDLGMHFDAQCPSRLENILNTYDFASNQSLITEAKQCIKLLLDNKITKYNYHRHYNDNPYPKKTKKRVLVVGQNHHDFAIRYGYRKPANFEEIILLAHQENPDAEIYFKPHPGSFIRELNTKKVAHCCTFLKADSSIISAFTEVDQVYCITSQAGFEALLRGIKVTVLGCPFYSGWGLTDDRYDITRRTRKLSLEELFAGACLLYTHYIDPQDGSYSNFITCLNFLVQERQLAPERNQ